MELLPTDVMLIIADALPTQYLRNLCRVCSRITTLLTNQEFFWQTKFIRDYRTTTYHPTSEWKKLYLFHRTLCVSYYKQLITSPDIIPSAIIAHHSFAIFVIDVLNNLWTYSILWENHVVQPFEFIQLPAIKVKAISYSYDHALFIDMNDDVWCYNPDYNGSLTVDQFKLNCNSNSIRKLGIKAKVTTSYLQQSAIIDLNDNVFVRGYFGVKSMFTELTQLPNIKAKQVCLNRNAIVILTLENKILIRGTNSFKKARFVIKLDIRAKKILLLDSCLFFIDLDDNAWCYHNDRLDAGFKNRCMLISIGIKAKQINTYYLNTNTICLTDVNGDGWIIRYNSSQHSPLDKIKIKDVSNLNVRDTILHEQYTISIK